MLVETRGPKLSCGYAAACLVLSVLVRRPISIALPSATSRREHQGCRILLPIRHTPWRIPQASRLKGAWFCLPGRKSPKGHALSRTPPDAIFYWGKCLRDSTIADASAPMNRQSPGRINAPDAFVKQPPPCSVSRSPSGPRLSSSLAMGPAGFCLVSVGYLARCGQGGHQGREMPITPFLGTDDKFDSEV